MTNTIFETPGDDGIDVVLNGASEDGWLDMVVLEIERKSLLNVTLRLNDQVVARVNDSTL